MYKILFIIGFKKQKSVLVKLFEREKNLQEKDLVNIYQEDKN